MDTSKEVVMYAAIAIDRIVSEYLDFVSPAKREVLADRIIKASTVEEDTPRSVGLAVDRALHIMKAVEEGATGDATGHKMRQKRLAEVKSIMHIANAYPSAAIDRLRKLPSKTLANA